MILRSKMHQGLLLPFRVIDYKGTVVHHWSLEKLQDRVRLMRQMHQYIDRPEYLQHFSLDNPFMETCMSAIHPRWRCRCSLNGGV